ncbi:SusC/RagA family TonB-linked outer membrane protein [Cyclobacterium qasimii]|uniref:SusC/RagA family TonB-linked outer membrane protein n=1 Tax=Cyclobacterium qasimii TaxID=1350429 RepID=A0A512CFU0_9BACT|nr:SusC/RagA family TonB-linked outer membrane protein [Cyclobacterium qasimii]GEO23046.1 SusC/RagA family TonB-linked outer membrane protein [Cyclobacterium qasimii]
MKIQIHHTALFIKIMRISLVQLIIFLVVTGVSVAGPSNAQNVLKINLSLEIDEQPIKDVLGQIEEIADVKFAYSVGLVKSKEKISLNIVNEELGSVLDEIFSSRNVKYFVLGKQIILNHSTNLKMSNNLVSIKLNELIISGKVSNKDGESLPGVTIRVKDTTIGTVTDIDGNYKLEIPGSNGVILVFSSIGFKDQEVSIGGRSIINLVLEEDVQSLNEVVVTALGVEKDPKSITYSTQKVSPAEAIKVKDPNFMNSLAGKVAGAVITKGNFGPGSAPRILLRGNKSLTGNSEPLFVLNGVPMIGGSDILSNYNPEDIESIQVLKGASAAALYGSEAANGVILVNTKKGQHGVSKVEFSSTFTVENAVDLPKLQTSYGQTDPNYNDSWGEKISNGSDSHLKEFFETGKTKINSVSFSNGSDIGQLYMSFSNTSASGILPKNKLEQNNFTVRLTSQFFNDKLSIDGSVNYTNQEIFNQNSAGGYSALPGIYSFPVGDDFSKYDKDNFEVWDPVRAMYVQNWPYIRNETFPNQNPYWVQNRNQRDFQRDHTISAFTAKLELYSWLDLQGRITYDKIYDKSEFRNYASTQGTVAGPNGGYGMSQSSIDNIYSDLLLIGNKNISADYNLAGTLGFSNRETTSAGLNLSSTVPTSLVFPNYFSVYALNGQYNKGESLRKTMTQAAFGNATLGYKEKIYLDITARNEWSSTVAQSFFYPSAGLSYILKDGSNDRPSASNVLSFAKLTASYAEVGNSLPFGINNRAPAMSLDNSGNLNPRGTLPFFNGTDTLNLNPERTKSYEFGTELRFLNNKLSLNLNYYNATTSDQILQIQAPAGAGASNFWINGGIIRNKGIEGIINYNSSIGEIQWASSLNFSHNKNQIRELSDKLDAERFVLTSFNQSRLVSIYLTRPVDGEYGSFGDMYGRVYEKDENGTLITDEDGLPQVSANPDQFIGNANPNFLAGLNNSFAYKNFSLSFLIDSRFGGGVINRTEVWLDYKGLSERSGEARDNGGVMVNGQMVDAKEYYLNQTGAGATAIASEYFFDATNIRLREFQIGYNLPLTNEFIKELNLSFVGRNLFFFYKKAPFDPEISVNTSPTSEGISSFSQPQTRSFGVSLRAIF